MQKKLNKKLIFGLILTSIALLSFLIIMILVLCDYNFQIDKMNEYVASNRSNGLTKFFKIFTHLGSFYTLAVLALIGIILIWFVKKDKRLSVFYAGIFAVVCISNFVIKQIVRRARPEHLMIIEETGFSFPSGHAMMTFAFFFLLAHFVWIIIKNKYLKVSLVVLLAFIIEAIGFSRIYLGVHYATDIIAGFLISFALVSIGLMLYASKFFRKNNKQQTKIE